MEDVKLNPTLCAVEGYVTDWGQTTPARVTPIKLPVAILSRRGGFPVSADVRTGLPRFPGRRSSRTDTDRLAVTSPYVVIFLFRPGSCQHPPKK